MQYLKKLKFLFFELLRILKCLTKRKCVKMREVTVFNTPTAVNLTTFSYCFAVYLNDAPQIQVCFFIDSNKC